MARFVPERGLDALVTQRWAVPAVNRLAREVRDAAALAAPDARVWITQHDERVRREHAETDGQTIPGNLRFAVPRPNTGNDVNDVRTGVEMAREPRDESLSIGNRIRCRCVAAVLPGLIGRRVKASDAVAYGNTARAEVSVTFYRIAESENPSSPDEGGGWFIGAAKDVARRQRGRP